MKTLFNFFFLCALLVSSFGGQAQSEMGQPVVPPKFYVSLFGQVGIPESEFKQYSKVRGGFRIEAGRFFSRNAPLSFGLELSGIFSGAKKDEFKGLEVKSTTTLINLQPFLRWVPMKPSKIRPYIDASLGMTSVITETTSTIVDEPTFLEQVLFGNETEVSTTTEGEDSATGFSYSIGTGLRIGKILMVGIRYQNVSPVDYVDKDEVYVQNEKIVYNKRTIPIDMIIITLGISNWGN